jgi:hypothetical protein
MSVAQQVGELSPLFRVCDLGDFVVVEHADSLTEAGDDRVGASDANPGKVIVGWIHDGVDVVALVGGMLVVSAYVAVTGFVVEFMLWRCNGGVNDDRSVMWVFIGFGASPVPWGRMVSEAARGRGKEESGGVNRAFGEHVHDLGDGW